jgi:hypothetical protein
VVEAIVERDARFVSPGAVPEGLAAELPGTRLLLLGETHYLEEHQQFLVALLPQLHAAGFRTLLEEALHATAWTGEEYVMGRSASLLRPLALLDQALLDGLRAFNAGLAEPDRIHFAGIDMNHWPGVFQAGAAEFQARFGQVATLDEIMAARPDDAAYLAALGTLPGRLAADRTALQATLGPARAAQLAELVEVEVRSQPLRARWDDGSREAIFVDRVAAALSSAGGRGVAVNCGMNHAQKETLSGPTPVALGTWLARHPETHGGDPASLKAIAFAAGRGERLWHFDDQAPWGFDLLAEAPPNSLTRLLAEKAAGRLAWLPLADPALSSADIRIDFGGGDGRVVPVGRQFDGIVLYPRASPLRSLSMP